MSAERKGWRPAKPGTPAFAAVVEARDWLLARAQPVLRGDHPEPDIAFAELGVDAARWVAMHAKKYGSVESLASAKLRLARMAGRLEARLADLPVLRARRQGTRNLRNRVQSEVETRAWRRVDAAFAFGVIRTADLFHLVYRPAGGTAGKASFRAQWSNRKKSATIGQ